MIKVYWTDNDGFANYRDFTDKELMPALKTAEELRQQKFRHVCISSELSESVGSPGVDTVADGKTPDGQQYEWSKQHRGAGPNKNAK